MKTKDLTIISAQPGDLIFGWQILVQLNNFRKYHLSDKYIVCVYRSPEREFHPIFKAMEKEFPETLFVYFDDPEGKCWHLIKAFHYHPICRPWCLKKLFEKLPELEDDAILYLDSDVVFTKYPDFILKYKDDDINYMSDTRSYIAASYWDSKIKDVIEKKKEAYKKRDILDECARDLGITRAICEANELNSGGAQYLLKNINAKFWYDVLEGCMLLRTSLRAVNDRFFESEDAGFQSWCSDMWAVLWNLWKRGAETRCPPEMDFHWAGTEAKKWTDLAMYHDAQPPKGAFSKMRYRSNEFTPWDDPEGIHTRIGTCSHKYVREILDTYPIFNNLNPKTWATQTTQQA